MGGMSESSRSGPPEPVAEVGVRERSARRLIATVPVALLVGVGSSLVLVSVTAVADRLQHLLWDTLPERLGLGTGTGAGPGLQAGSAWWIVLILTVTGVAVGLVVALVPGHAGPDPATEALIGPPMQVWIVPGVLLAAALALAGGVSLGPENPITAANIAIACALGVRFFGRSAAPGFLGLAAAGTIGALFGTPVAAALILSEIPMGDPREPLWDRLFAPLLSAAAGALVIQAVDSPVFAIDVPAYTTMHAVDVLTAAVVTLAAGVVGLALVYAFPFAHAAFQRLRNPVLMVATAGLVLGLLGAVGGMITLFKGLEQTKTLVDQASTCSTWALVGILVIKCLALLVAASGGFRGGRIFPAVFIGTTLGLVATRVFDDMPVGLAIGCGVLGVVVALTQQGWLSIFLAVALVQDARLIPLLCVSVLPVWLLVLGRPQMLVTPPDAAVMPGEGGSAPHPTAT